MRFILVVILFIFVCTSSARLNSRHNFLLDLAERCIRGSANGSDRMVAGQYLMVGEALVSLESAYGKQFVWELLAEGSFALREVFFSRLRADALNCDVPMIFHH